VWTYFSATSDYGASVEGYGQNQVAWYALSELIDVIVIAVACHVLETFRRAQHEAIGKASASGRECSAAVALLKRTCDAVTDLDEEFRLVGCTKRFESLLRLNPEQSLAGTVIWDLAPEADRQGIIDRVRTWGHCEDMVESLEVQLLDALSSVLHLELLLTQFEGVDGSLHCLVGVRRLHGVPADPSSTSAAEQHTFHPAESVRARNTVKSEPRNQSIIESGFLGAPSSFSGSNRAPSSSRVPLLQVDFTVTSKGLKIKSMSQDLKSLLSLGSSISGKTFESSLEDPDTFKNWIEERISFIMNCSPQLPLFEKFGPTVIIGVTRERYAATFDVFFPSPAPKALADLDRYKVCVRVRSKRMQKEVRRASSAKSVPSVRETLEIISEVDTESKSANGSAE